MKILGKTNCFRVSSESHCLLIPNRLSYQIHQPRNITMKPHVFPMICLKKRCSNNQVHTSAIESQLTRLTILSMASWDECQPLFTVWLLNETARDMQTISRCHYNRQSTTPIKTPSKPFFRHQPLTTWKSRPGLTNSGPMTLIDFTCYPTADAFRCDQFTAGDLLLCIHIETYNQTAMLLVVVFSTHLFWRWNILSDFSTKKKRQIPKIQ